MKQSEQQRRDTRASLKGAPTREVEQFHNSAAESVYRKYSNDDFVKALEGLEIASEESVFAVDVKSSIRGDSIKASYSEDCSNWFDIPKAAVEQYRILGLGCAGSDPNRVLVAIKLHREFRSLLPLFRSVANKGFAKKKTHLPTRTIKALDFEGYWQPVTPGAIQLKYVVNDAQFVTNALVYVPETDAIITLTSSNPLPPYFTVSSDQELGLQVRNVPDNGNVWGVSDIQPSGPGADGSDLPQKSVQDMIRKSCL